MYSTSEWLPERDPDTITPVGGNIMCRIIPEKWDSPIMRPDTLKKGDTTRRSNHASVYKVASRFKDTIRPGVEVIVDPSIDPGSWNRAFRWKDDTYFICPIDTLEGVEFV